MGDLSRENDNCASSIRSKSNFDKTIYPANQAQPFTFSKGKALRRRLFKLMRNFYTRLFFFVNFRARSTT